jgi:hypothetical protein
MAHAVVSPVVWLRLEGLAVLLLSFRLYAEHGAGWLLLLVLFFVPDVSMLGYVHGPATGARLYNLAHTYTLPLLVGAVGVGLHHSVVLSTAMIWTAHIALDRMLGYGLKLSSGFQDTHLGRIGRSTREATGAAARPRPQ